MHADYVESYYAQTRSPGEPHPGLEGHVEAEICVVGAGLAGLSCALSLAERGRDVVLKANGQRIGSV